MESLNNLTLQDFLARAASGEATPGGGSVAALAGALAAAMASMVANLTVGRPRYADVENECRDLIVKANDRRAVLQRLLDEDVRVFEALMAAYRRPKGDTEEQQARKQEAVHKALDEAIRVPLETARAALDVLKMARRLVEIGNVNAVSDAGVAACLAEAALAAALRNVDINLRGVTDAARAAAIRSERETLADKARRLRKEADRLLDAHFKTR